MKKKSLFIRLFALVAAMMCALGMQAAEAYACFTPEDSTLTFYFDNLRSSRSGTTYDLNTESNAPEWDNPGIYYYLTRVVFDPSFADARPTSTYQWFHLMINMKSITGMQYLNTSEVTNMGYMFSGCIALTSLDLSNFNTANVTIMDCMFLGCSGLTSLDLGSFNTANVTRFYSMFYGCSGLTSLDLSNFNTAKVEIMDSMFRICSSLTTIYAGDGWNTAAVSISKDMFSGCTSLVGGMGTTYDENHVDAAYAHIDGGPSNPGYLSEKTTGKRGDVNGDGNVNIGDVTTLIDYLLSGNASGVNLTAADCDQDSSVNISDVTTLIDYLLSGSW